MYRCGVCRDLVGPGVPMLKHTVYRPNRQIAYEVPLCRECDDDLLAGIDFNALVREMREEAPRLDPSATAVLPHAVKKVKAPPRFTPPVAASSNGTPLFDRLNHRPNKGERR